MRLEIGYIPSRCIVTDLTVGTITQWAWGMAEGSFTNGTAVTTSNGFTWLGNTWMGGMSIQGWNQGTTGSYIVVNNLGVFAKDLTVGSKIKVAGVVGLRFANSQNLSLNGTYTVSSINVSSGYIYTVEQPNDPTPYEEYAGGGTVIPVATASGVPIPTHPSGLYACLIGTGMGGAANSAMSAEFFSAVSVV